MQEVFQVIKSSPKSSGSEIGEMIDNKFTELCNQANKFSNKEKIISEAREYKNEVLKDLDAYIQEVRDLVISQSSLKAWTFGGSEFFIIEPLVEQ